MKVILINESRFYLIVVIFSCFTLLMTGCKQTVGIKRIGSVIGIKKEAIPEYKRLHADAWPGVLKMIDKANIHNYSIYLGAVDAGRYYLFSYLEYTGKNFEADMAKMAKDETTKKWWTHTDPLQFPLPTRRPGEWWSQWQEVFHFAGPKENRPPTSRHGGIIDIAKQNILVYNQLHAAVWPGVLEAIEKANIRNYSIYQGKITDNEYLLFSYFEYYGDNFDADMKTIADNEITQKWWTYTDPLQRPLPTRKKDEWWASMEEVFHTD
jgi:L-rhamnose mutarotase